MTLDTHYQPSIHVDENMLRKADDIFEREQVGVAEHAATGIEPEPEELYVNENGYASNPRCGLGTFSNQPCMQVLNTTSTVGCSSRMG